MKLLRRKRASARSSPPFRPIPFQLSHLSIAARRLARLTRKFIGGRVFAIIQAVSTDAVPGKNCQCTEQQQNGWSEPKEQKDGMQFHK